MSLMLWENKLECLYLAIFFSLAGYLHYSLGQALALPKAEHSSLFSLNDKEKSFFAISVRIINGAIMQSFSGTAAIKLFKASMICYGKLERLSVFHLQTFQV